MHRSLRGAVVLLQVMAFGCANMSSVHRSLDVNGGKGVLIDIKQRAILVRAIPLKVCAEPSPDSLSAYAAEISGKLDSAAKASVAVGLSSQEAASFVGLRTASIQLLRDSLYRACEMYLNGAIDELQYQILIRRYQKYTVALLAIEQLTVATRAQASAPLTPTIAPTPAPRPAPAPSPTPAPPASTPTAAPSTAAATPDGGAFESWRQSPVVFAALVATKTRTPTPPGVPPGTPASTPAATLPAPSEGTRPASPGGNLTAVAEVVREIVMTVLNTDDEAQLCMAYLKEGTLKEPLLSICTDYIKGRNDVYLHSLARAIQPTPPSPGGPIPVPTFTPPPVKVFQLSPF